jgi:glycosyltransferase involved in cell wall biosynthesis
MNICFLSQEYPPETKGGGIGTYTHNMASALVKLGHNVHVVTSTRSRGGTFEEGGVWIHRIKKPHLKPKELELLLYSWSASRKLAQIDCDFDLVQASEFEGEAFWYSSRRDCPLLTRLATPFFLIEKLNGKVFKGPRPLLDWIEKKQTLQSDGIIAPSKSLADAAAEKWEIDPSEIEVIPNGVDISRIIRLGEAGSAPESLKDQRYLLYFGRLEERKGVRVLADALPEILERYPSLKMVFVGHDQKHSGVSMREHISCQAGPYREQIIFFDYIPQEQLFSIVRSALLVVFPSVWEAFGFVCVEALALGRPVVASSGSGFGDIIEDGISGYLVEPGSSEMLANRILSCLYDEKSLKQVSQQASQRAQLFEASRIAQRLVAIYEKTRENWLQKKKGGKLK